MTAIVTLFFLFWLLCLRQNSRSNESYILSKDSGMSAETTWTRPIQFTLFFRSFIIEQLNIHSRLTLDDDGQWRTIVDDNPEVIEYLWSFLVRLTEAASMWWTWTREVELKSWEIITIISQSQARLFSISICRSRVARKGKRGRRSWVKLPWNWSAYKRHSVQQTTSLGRREWNKFRMKFRLRWKKFELVQLWQKHM